ncbi:NAD(P)-dependent oxidoreductase [uncultured Anaerococcus sp.]|uniref:NAD(P)-dependent oxidoreductase n=1 Tax=uncultured Anaerococcus sp. TaxID=293428 RepID=UPI0025E27259|nr:NAD(P)-dependent oxidoreductase [uncultured Anaerococcus sp.]
MKICIYNPNPLSKKYIKEWEKENNIEVYIIDEPINKDNLDKLEGADGLVVTASSEISDDMYQKIADYGIKQISITSVGYDKINLEKADEAGLIITNTPDYSPESIAEFTVMMILKLLKKDSEIQKDMKNKDFRFSENKLGQTIRGKTLGIYGLGNIGYLVAQALDGFGVDVIATTPHPKTYAKNIIEFVEFDELLEKSDIISVHAALVDENFHQFDKNAFDKMKDDSFIVNTSRGGLIDTNALLEAIDNEKIAGAALDVYENEEGIYGKDNPSYDDELFNKLLDHPKVDMYNHVAFFTETALENQMKFALNNAVEVIKTGDSNKRVN